TALMHTKFIFPMSLAVAGWVALFGVSVTHAAPAYVEFIPQSMRAVAPAPTVISPVISDEHIRQIAEAVFNELKPADPFLPIGDGGTIFTATRMSADTISVATVTAGSAEVTDSLTAGSATIDEASI